jgi:tellurite resistance protein TerA
MASLTKGGNAPIGGTEATVTVRWSAGQSGVAEVDISAFMLQASRKVKSDSGMVFYGQRRSADGSVEVTDLDRKAGGDAVETRFRVDLARVPADIEIIAFTATIGGSSRAPFGSLGALQITAASGETHDFAVPLAGASEAALIVGELYRRQGQWKFRAVGQGFNGGLKPLAESMGVSVDDAPAAAPPPPPPRPAPPPPPPQAAPPPPPASSAPINLSKVTLTKAKPSIDLTKKSSGYGEVRINLNWHRPPPKSGGFFSRQPKGVDLDLACLFEMQDGRLGAVQALGRSFGAFNAPPFIELAGDDRTGSSVDGEWMRINGQNWQAIKRILIYTFIYEGAANWAETDGVITIFAPDQAPIEVRLDEGRSGANTCAIALFENVGGQMRVNREVVYFADAEKMDRQYQWGLNWRSGSKG